ncbi:MAG: NAD(P)-dependent alcohol dehydrogenase [Methanobacterium sp. BRmetb2]|nr:MAG: NAD(P)-dependent alcohol dehydrogenase [Methanobacterium sp. BRmetb2]
MKAIVCTKYGPPDVLKLKEVEKPIPKDNEVLIRIHAATVTAGDCEIRRFQMPTWLWIPARIGFGFTGPRKKILGQELAGEIEEIGKDVKRFRKGAQVFAFTGFSLGAYAEYACVSEEGVLAEKPVNMTYEEAATVPMGGIIALHYLKKGNIQSGDKVLINGASGSIGTIAVHFAKYLGAEVTGVCSTTNLDMVRSIGADHVIDYAKEDFTDRGETYHVIFDVVGKSPFSNSLKSLKRNGSYLLGNPGISQMVRGRWAGVTSNNRVISGTESAKNEDLILLKGLMESGGIDAVIDRRYTLEQTAEAHKYVEKGHKKGNVIITVGNDTSKMVDGDWNY